MKFLVTKAIFFLMVRILKIFLLSSGIFSSCKLSQAYKTESILSSEETDNVGRNLHGDPGTDYLGSSSDSTIYSFGTWGTLFN